MTTRLELILRAALCRQLAKRELANQAIWMAEAKLAAQRGGDATAGEFKQLLGAGSQLELNTSC
jgi:hypothetical protein